MATRGYPANGSIENRNCLRLAWKCGTRHGAVERDGATARSTMMKIMRFVRTSVMAFSGHVEMHGPYAENAGTADTDVRRFRNQA